MRQNMVAALNNIPPHWNILSRNIFVTRLKYIVEYIFFIHVQMFTLTCLVFELQQPFATYYIFTPMNVIEQVT